MCGNCKLWRKSICRRLASCEMRYKIISSLNSGAICTTSRTCYLSVCFRMFICAYVWGCACVCWVSVFVYVGVRDLCVCTCIGEYVSLCI